MGKLKKKPSKGNADTQPAEAEKPADVTDANKAASAATRNTPGSTATTATTPPDANQPAQANAAGAAGTTPAPNPPEKKKVILRYFTIEAVANSGIPRIGQIPYFPGLEITGNRGWRIVNVYCDIKLETLTVYLEL